MSISPRLPFVDPLANVPPWLAHVLTMDEARRTASNIAKRPTLVPRVISAGLHPSRATPLAWLKRPQQTPSSGAVSFTPASFATNDDDVVGPLAIPPGQLRDILGPVGGALSEVLASPQAKAVLAGIAAMVFKRMMGGSQTA